MNVTTPLAPRPDDRIGRSIGSYQIGSLLGEGGMGSVYAATIPHLGKRAAVKFISRQLSGNPELVARFVTEARALVTIDHQYIVEVYDAGTYPDDGTLYIVMEYIDGCSLESLCVRNGPLGLDVASTIILQIAAGLHAVHEASIVHRDMKCQNVMISRRRGLAHYATIVDFGIAKFVDAQRATGYRTQSRTVVGTPGMMAPEQARGERDVDARADIYSLAGMLYRMVTGRPPFTAETEYELYVRQSKGLFPRPRLFRQDIPPVWEEVIAAALDSSRDKRPASMMEFAQQIARGRPSGEMMLQVLATELQRRPSLPPGERTLIGLSGSDDGAPVGLEASLVHWGSQPRSRITRWLPLAVAAIAGIAVGVAGMMLLGGSRGAPPVESIGVQETSPPSLPAAAAGGKAAAPVTVASVSVDAAPRPLEDAGLQPAILADAAKAPEVPTPAASPASPLTGSARAERPTPIAPPSGPQKITIKVRPWAEVFRGSDSTGQQTPVQFTLTPGTHRIRMIGPNDRREELVITVDDRGIVVRSDRSAAETFRVGRVAEIKRNWQ